MGIGQNVESMYDELYAEGQAVLEKYNPCNIQPDGSCTKMQYGASCYCCESCEHLGPTGCKVKSLACKLWLCHDARMANKEAVHKLRLIERKARDSGVPMEYRYSKQQNFAK